jgi:hypothetical protein
MVDTRAVLNPQRTISQGKSSSRQRDGRLFLLPLSCRALPSAFTRPIVVRHGRGHRRSMRRFHSLPDRLLRALSRSQTTMNRSVRLRAGEVTLLLCEPVHKLTRLRTTFSNAIQVFLIFYVFLSKPRYT